MLQKTDNLLSALIGQSADTDDNPAAMHLLLSCCCLIIYQNNVKHNDGGSNLILESKGKWKLGSPQDNPVDNISDNHAELINFHCSMDINTVHTLQHCTISTRKEESTNFTFWSLRKWWQWYHHNYLCLRQSYQKVCVTNWMRRVWKI